MKKILICGHSNKIKTQNQYYLINNFLKNFYDENNVHVVKHLSFAKNYKTNFDKKVTKYGCYLSDFYFDVLNTYKINKLKNNFCKNYILYFAEAVARISLSRLYKLHYCKKIKKIDYIEVQETKNFEHNFQNTIEFQSFYQSNLYKNLRLSDFINQKIIDYNLVKLNKILDQSVPNNINEKEIDVVKSKFLQKTLFNFLSKFKRNNIVVVHKPFIGSINNIKLQLLLGQMPWTPMSYKLDFVKKNTLLREDIKRSLILKKKDPIKKFLSDVFLELMPTCFLENITNIENLSKKVFPDNPKLIFTSNAFAADEVFKYWSSSKTEKLIIGQHGCNYCTTKYKINPSVEEKIPKKFITWGLENFNTHYSGVNFLDNKINNFNIKNNKITLILYAQKGEYFFDEFFDFIEYQNFYKKFISKFLIDHKNFQIIIKPHKTHKYNLINEIDFWKQNFSNIQFADDRETVEDLINNSYLTIFSYDSTDFFKALHRKKNIIFLSHNNLEHIREDVIENYNLLKDKIIFTNINKFLEVLNNDILKLNSYFDKKNINSAKKIFNAKLNINSKHKIYKLSKCINHIQKNI